MKDEPKRVIWRFANRLNSPIIGPKLCAPTYKETEKTGYLFLDLKEDNDETNSRHK